MNIIICDSNVIEAEKCHGLISDFAQKNKKKFNIEIVETTQNLLFNIETIKLKIDLIYLATSFPNTSVLDVIKILRESGYDKEIIFYTNEERYAIAGYDFEVFNYILKDKTTVKKFETVLYKAFEKYLKRKKNTIILRNISETRWLNLDEIKYFEINQRNITAFLDNNQEFSFYGTLSELEKKLKDNNFIRIHKSFLVNSLKINKLTNSDVYLECGKKIRIGRFYKNNIVSIINNSQLV